MQKEETKFQSSTIFEGMTSIRSVIRAIDENISTRRIDKIYYDAQKISKIAKEIGYFKAVSAKYGFQLIESCAEELSEMTTGNTHGGIIAACREREIPNLLDEKPQGNFFVMLQGIIGAFGVRIPVAFFISKLSGVTLFQLGLATPSSTIVQIVLCIMYFILNKKKKKDCFL